MQVYREVHKFARLTHIRVVPVYGGAGIKQQISELRRGAEVVVCTPGRMMMMMMMMMIIIIIIIRRLHARPDD